MSMSVLPLANDKVGGVTVTIEEPELKTVNPAFVQGQTVTLRGGQAEEYVRYRDTGRAQSALVRMERQKTYIKGFLDAARNKSRLDDSLIPDLMKEIEPYMVTDMTKDRYLDMALDFLGREPGFYGNRYGDPAGNSCGDSYLRRISSGSGGNHGNRAGLVLQAP